eukprot:403358379
MLQTPMKGHQQQLTQSIDSLSTKASPLKQIKVIHSQKESPLRQINCRLKDPQQIKQLLDTSLESQQKEINIEGANLDQKGQVNKSDHHTSSFQNKTNKNHSLKIKTQNIKYQSPLINSKQISQRTYANRSTEPALKLSLNQNIKKETKLPQINKEIVDETIKNQNINQSNLVQQQQSQEYSLRDIIASETPKSQFSSTQRNRNQANFTMINQQHNQVQSSIHSLKLENNANGSVSPISPKRANNLGFNHQANLTLQQNNSSSHHPPQNLFNGLTPRQFIEEIEKQLNVKELNALRKKKKHHNNHALQMVQKLGGAAAQYLNVNNGRDSNMTVFSSNSYYLNEDYLTGSHQKIRSKTHSKYGMNNTIGGGGMSNLTSKPLLTPSVKMKGVGFDQTPYSKLLQSLDKPKKRAQQSQDYQYDIQRNQEFLMMASARKRKEHRLYDQLERNLHPILLEQQNQKDEDHQLNQKLQGIQHSKEQMEERVQELQKQINIKELNCILKDLGHLNHKNHKEMLPNIEGGKRFYYSYKKLQLRDD